MTGLDPRRHAFRPDLAEIGLRGRVDAERFVAGEAATIRVPVAPVFKLPGTHAARQTELLYGEPVQVIERQSTWAWVQSTIDGYVGYVADAHLQPGAGAPSHILTLPGAWVFDAPDMKSPPRHRLSLGSRLTMGEEIEIRGTRYLDTGDGFIVDRGLRPLPLQPGGVDAALGVARGLLGCPYLWAGRSSMGLDCSALVQLALQLAGYTAPRDSDMQQQELGELVDDHQDFTRFAPGDLLFWKGHVGILADARHLLHANGHTMNVATEKLEDAIERIGYLYGFPTTLRRP